MIPFEFRIKYKLYLTMFKILNNIVPIYLRFLFQMGTLCWNLRSSSNCRKIIDIRNCNNSFSFKICPAWNRLPKIDLHECSSI